MVVLYLMGSTNFDQIAIELAKKTPVQYLQWCLF